MNTSGGAWLSVSQAAARLGVSERTVQRRAAAGELRARKTTTRDGQKWEIRLGADTPAIGAANIADTLSSEQSDSTPQSGGTVPPSAAIGADTREGDLMAALIAEKDARIADLREQLQAANSALQREQSAHAETRRLFAFSVAALPSPTNVAPDVATTSATTNRPPQHPQRRRPRRLWRWPWE